jgi:hypothetical protein
MKQQERIPRSKLHRFFAGISGFRQLAILIECPRQHVPGIGVAPDFKLLLRKIDGLGELDVVIGIEQREVAIVKDLIDVPKQSDVLDQSKLLLRLLVISLPLVEVAKLGNKCRHGHNGNGALVEHNCLRVPAAVRPELA